MIDFKGAIFDLDGTLLDSMWVWEHVDRSFLGRRGIAVPDDYIEIISPIGFYKAADYTIKRFNLKDSPQDLMDEWNELALDAYSNKVTLKPGAYEYLTSLKKRGVRLAVATASSPDLYEPALKNNKIYGLFDEIVNLREVSRDKSFPDIYIHTAQKIEVNADDCVVFEDIYSAIRGAKSGGFYTVGVYDEYSKKDKEKIIDDADMFIYSFDELL